jgi:hypothetical protein
VPPSHHGKFPCHIAAPSQVVHKRITGSYKRNGVLWYRIITILRWRSASCVCTDLHSLHIHNLQTSCTIPSSRVTYDHKCSKNTVTENKQDTTQMRSFRLAKYQSSTFASRTFILCLNFCFWNDIVSLFYDTVNVRPLHWIHF